MQCRAQKPRTQKHTSTLNLRKNGQKSISTKSKLAKKLISRSIFKSTCPTFNQLPEALPPSKFVKFPHRDLANAVQLGDIALVQNSPAQQEPRLDVNSNKNVSDPSPSLIHAIERHDVKSVLLLAKNGADINLPGGKQHMAPFLYVIKKNSPFLFSKFLALNPETHVTTPDNKSAMTIAGEAGVQVAILDELLGMGLAVDHRDCHGRTPLMYAARIAAVPQVEWWLDHGADPLAQDNQGKSVLNYAQDNRNRKVFDLVQTRLQSSNKTQSFDQVEEDAAANKVFTLMFAQTSESNESNPSNNSTSLPAHPEVKSKHSTEQSPLILAIKRRDVESVLSLAQNGTDINLPDGQHQMTPFLHAIEQNFLPLFSKLLALGPNIHVNTAENKSPMTIAAEAGVQLPILDGLFSLGLAIDHRDCYGRTPLMYAVRKARRSHIVWWLDHGANPFVRDKEGKSALDHAKDGVNPHTLNQVRAYVKKLARGKKEAENAAAQAQFLEMQAKARKARKAEKRMLEEQKAVKAQKEREAKALKAQKEREAKAWKELEERDPEQAEKIKQQRKEAQEAQDGQQRREKLAAKKERRANHRKLLQEQKIAKVARTARHAEQMQQQKEVRQARLAREAELRRQQAAEQEQPQTPQQPQPTEQAEQSQIAQ